MVLFEAFRAIAFSRRKLGVGRHLNFISGERLLANLYQYCIVFEVLDKKTLEVGFRAGKKDGKSLRVYFSVYPRAPSCGIKGGSLHSTGGILETPPSHNSVNETTFA